MPTIALSKGVPVTLFTDAVTGTSPSISIPSSCDQLAVSIKTSDDTVSAGELVIEEASDPNYTGTWSLLQTITPVQDSEQVIHIFSILRNIRVRFTDDLTGGATASAEIVGN